MKPDRLYAGALVGRQLCGKWHLLRILGSGGMSTVFEGLHRNGKRAAIKVLHPELAANRRARNRFKREAYVANQVGHPNVVPVLDDDVSEEGLVFLVMEYLEGETLGTRLARLRKPLPVAEVVTVAINVLDILAVAHRAGIVHRDVKPDNIFVTQPSGEIKLLDFGIASLRELSAGLSELTATGAALGTPAFMAPEQARGRADEVDATTDLWSVGATMFRLLTGRFVHVGKSSMEVVIATATRSPPSLASGEMGLPTELVSLVDRALAFEKPARWPDAASMREALHALNLHLPVKALCETDIPLAGELSTQDETNEANETRESSEPSSAALEARAGPRASALGRRRALPLSALAMVVTVAVGTGAWLMPQARQTKGTELRSDEVAVPVRDRFAAMPPSVAAPPKSDQPGGDPPREATAVSMASTAVPSRLLGQGGELEKKRATTARTIEVKARPSIESPPSPPVIDPLDRR